MTLLKKVLQSSSLLVASKMLQRLVGLVSIMILARLLTPDDFAIVALTAIIIYFFDMLSNVGTEQYIIQKDHVTTQDLNTAWTIDLISKCVLWLLLISSASFISDYFEQPQLKSAIYVMSLLLPLNALKNPGTFLLKSELNYEKLFWLSLIQKSISFMVVITIASLSPSYWALIIADLVASVVFLIGSYKIQNFRPSFSLVNSNEQWLFSKWLLLKGIAGYIRSQIDTLIVSKLFSPAVLGQYYMVRNIAMLPNHNLLIPAIEPLLAAFKANRGNEEQLAFQVRLSLFVVSLVATPIAFFIWAFPEPIIDTLLGSQWVQNYTVLSSMALLFFYLPFLLTIEQCLLSLQKVKFLAAFDFTCLIAITSILLFFTSSILSDFAFIRGALGLLTFIVALICLQRIIDLRIPLILMHFVPALSAAFIATKLTVLAALYAPEPSVIKLIYTGAVFLLIYATLCFFLCSTLLKQSQEFSYIHDLIKNFLLKSLIKIRT